VLPPLLTTKLYAPPPRAERVSRARLLARLDDAVRPGCRLLLVSAPAGFGKSTLLSEWAHHIEARALARSPTGPGTSPDVRAQVAWVSLDKRDNDPRTFWSYVIAALSRTRAGLGADVTGLPRSTDPLALETVLTGVINEIAQASGPDGSGTHLALVLDDYHVIEAQAVHDSVAFLLDHLPPNVHLILASRSDPPLPLSQLRGRGQMIEVRQADLRFGPDEADAFLTETMGLSLGAQQVEALARRTEGWIVGLQMAALSMRGRDEAQVHRFVRSFAGSHRYVLDYLTDEVLDRQPAVVQRFLLQTSILDRLTGSLCDALTGRGDGVETLEALEAGNLFLVPLDSQRRWYRYHHLFAELLRSRLDDTQHDQVPALHQQASAWYEACGLIAEAMHHSLVAGDVARFARLVGGNALAMLEHGELATIKSWLEALPDAAVHDEPWLSVAQAWMLAFSGQSDAAEPLLQDAERMAARRGLLQERQHIGAHVAAVRTYLAVLQGEPSGATELARQALALLPPKDGMTRGWAAMVLGLNLYQRGDVAAALQALTDAAAIAQDSGDGHVTVLSLCNLAAIRMEIGELGRATGMLRDALRLAADFSARSGRFLPISAYTHVLFSELLYEHNDLTLAHDHLREAIEICERWGEPIRRIGAYTKLAQLFQAMGRGDDAREALDRAEQLAQGLSPWVAARVAAAQALLALRLGELSSASRWADAHQAAPAAYFSVFEHWSASLLVARIEIACGQLAPAIARLHEIHEDAEAAGMIHHLVEAMTLEAVAYHTQGDLERALAALGAALDLSRSEGYVRVFLDEGPPMGELLEAAARRGIAPQYTAKLLAAFGEPREGQPRAGGDESAAAVGHAASSDRPAPSLVEALTEREQQVLRLLAAGLANTEIAERLYISANTVKSHLKHIYAKLDVHSRMQAVRRARQLGLL
jgi:LuxR family maltose regulon positive regulatory protein